MPPVYTSSPMRLEDLVEGLPINLAPGNVQDYAIRHITDDSRQVVGGSLFVARSGTQTDGVRHIDDAIAAGAAAILVENAVRVESSGVAVLRCAEVPAAAAVIAERLFGNPSQHLQLIGITGTNGKTTIAHLIRHILSHAQVCCGVDRNGGD